MSQFNLRNLSVLAYANGFTLLHYKAENQASVRTAGFFNNARDLVATGDMVLVSSPEGGAVLFVTSAAVGQDVAVAPMGQEPVSA